MSNPFGSREMAAGYAKSRPAVHPEVLRLAHQHLAGRTFDCALDLGCGAGLSTAPVRAMARRTVGLEPNVSMLEWASETAPGAVFTAASAERLPFADAAFDLIAAAGALNYVDLPVFFAEAARVLRPDGAIVVYDFSQGRSFTDGPALDDWFGEFKQRYPQPPGEAHEINPEILARDATCGFSLQYAERFEIPLSLTPEFYLDYAMTETNVAAAVRAGTPRDEIRDWCAASIAKAFDGRPRGVIFRGYFAILSRPR